MSVATTESGLTCSRCRNVRYPTAPADPFICHRCAAVLGGGNAADPVRPGLSDERRRALAHARVARAAQRARPGDSDRGFGPPDGSGHTDMAAPLSAASGAAE